MQPPDEAVQVFGPAGLRFGHTMDQLAASTPTLRPGGRVSVVRCLLCHGKLVAPTVVRTSAEGVACDDCFQLHWRA